MWYAVDRTTEKTLAADDARARRGRRYLCPTCRKPVALRAGPTNSPYFAHLAHAASPDCENYHPGSGYSGGHGPYIAPPRPLSLYLALLDPQRGRSKWQLELLVPRSPDEHGVVFVEAGISGTIPVNCSRLQDSGRRVPVRILTDSYELRVSNDADVEYRRKLSVTTPGLDTVVANAFRYSDDGGRRLSADSSLYWGRGYYLVWSRSLAVRWPKTIWHEELSDIGTWRCARVELPPDPDDAVANWAAHLLERDVERPPVSLSLVAPASATRLEDESIVIPHGSEVLVGIVGEYGSAMPDELRLTMNATRESQSLQLRDQTPQVVSLGQLPMGVASLELIGDDEIQLTLSVRPRTYASQSAGPTLRFGTSSEAVAMPSYSLAAELALQQARLGGKELNGVSLPVRARIQLRTRASARAEWNPKTFAWDLDRALVDPAAHRNDLEKGLLVELLSVLQSSNEIDLDFGNFGSLVLAAPVAVDAPRRVLKLSASLRQRIQWVSVLPQTASHHRPLMAVPELVQTVRTILTSFVHVANANDREMLTNLGARRAWPRDVIPQLRELTVDLLNLTRSGS